MTRGPATVLGLIAAAVCFAFWQYGNSTWQWALLPWLYIAGGLLAWCRRPENRTGLLLVGTGVAYSMFALQSTGVPLLLTIGIAFEMAFLPALAYLLLSFPDGRLAHRWERVLVAAAIAWTVLFVVVAALQYDPLATGCATCRNLLLIDSHPEILVALWRFYELTALPRLVLLELMLLLLAAVCVVRLWRASAVMRRVLGTLHLAAVPLLLFLAMQGVFNYVGVGAAHPDTATVIWTAGTYLGLAHPMVFLLGLFWAWARRARAAEILIELGDVSRLDAVEAALAQALGDSSLSLGRWDTATRAYLTPGGQRLQFPSDGSDRTTTYLAADGRPVAAVVHDRALLSDRWLLDSVGAATRLAIDNEWLQAELRTQLEEVRASRARILAAADLERRRLERDLHDGAQQRLVTLALDARMVEAKLAKGSDTADVRASVVAIAEGLASALTELRDLARGIHPSPLTEEGLGPALRSLAERSPVPTRLVAVPSRRFDSAVEAAAYFVVSEALTNAAKHAQASEVTISIGQTAGRLEVMVADDGVGGAELGRGSGLCGLADRVAAVDGHLDVKSPRGAGTTVLAEIPCVSP